AAALAGCGARPVGAVGLLFDERGAERKVDAPLDGRALIVAQVDRARQLDECRVEAAGCLVLADSILDVPEGRVDLLERGDLGGESARRPAHLGERCAEGRAAGALQGL